ncbi:hypothetical protein ACS7SF_19085 (plasmid) [Ralstonia sp. 25C]|uniref:hypothetical protein n=1 Tax=Ralstonia sp. 25C TaxID=3447363 RepID=UPI003F74B9CD
MSGMIDFDADIVSGVSIGGIRLGESISSYLTEMHSFHRTSMAEYKLPDGSSRFAYTVDEVLTVATLSDGGIFSVGCNSRYRGRYNASLRPGQTMAEVLKLTQRQRIFNGNIIVNEDFGFSFMLPAPYDEVADCIGDVPAGLVLEDVYVSDFSTWNSGR